jgi:hypothetical protein
MKESYFYTKRHHGYGTRPHINQENKNKAFSCRE